MPTKSFAQSNAVRIQIPLAIAVCVTLFLFYIDEGFYNFNWMLSPGNWFAFVIYVGILFGAQWLVLAFFTTRLQSKPLIWLRYAVGIGLGLLIAFKLFQ